MRYIEVTMLFGLTLQPDQVTFLLSVFLDILFGSLEDHPLLGLSDISFFESLRLSGLKRSPISCLPSVLRID